MFCLITDYDICNLGLGRAGRHVPILSLHPIIIGTIRILELLLVTLRNVI